MGTRGNLTSGKNLWRAQTCREVGREGPELCTSSPSSAAAPASAMEGRKSTSRWREPQVPAAQPPPQYS